ncbi:RNA 3'-terminal phosphate cyclase [Natrialbaceae archaeon A-arb3/5]
MTTVRKLDGSDAGGQFLRTALGLAVCRNEPIRIENVRGDRSEPGLRHQHLAVVETMAECCDAAVSGAELGSETIGFDPTAETRHAATYNERSSRTTDSSGRDGAIAGGQYVVDIGTAGSVTLLFDALLPLATVLESPLSVTVTGGTDVQWSPPIDYFQSVKLPLLRRFGLVAACEVDRRGFYPDGGGRATLHLAPSQLEPIDLHERGAVTGVRLYSTEAASLADRDVARRQAAGARKRLESALGRTVTSDHGDDSDGSACELLERRETTAASDCPGSALVVRLEHAHGVAGFSALGERGKPAERVGEDAADAANRFLETDAPVDRHMADQLLVFLALAGGRVRLPTVTDHVEASRELLDSFDVPIDLVADAETTVATVSRTGDPM